MGAGFRHCLGPHLRIGGQLPTVGGESSSLGREELGFVVFNIECAHVKRGYKYFTNSSFVSTARGGWSYRKDFGRKKKIYIFLLFELPVCLFVYRERKGGRKKGRETSMCSCLSCAPYWGPGRQPRHVA